MAPDTLPAAPTGATAISSAAYHVPRGPDLPVRKRSTRQRPPAEFLFRMIMQFRDTKGNVVAESLGFAHKVYAPDI